MGSIREKSGIGGLLIASVNALSSADASEVSVGAKQLSGQGMGHLEEGLANEFHQSLGIDIDWDSVTEVSDDEEGSSYIFVHGSGLSVRVPMDAVQHSAPNKFEPTR